MESENNQSISDVLKTISQDRGRTNILRKYEQRALAYLVQRIPSWMSSDMLTAIGFLGSIIIFVSFILATYFGGVYLLLGVLGYLVCWFGDSLDGRVAYYRNKQRKWYGFALDLTTDWIGIVLMGWGFVIYVDNQWEILGFCFVVLYGWEILTTLLRYKITDKYSIDSGLLGPTEVRIVISLILILEVLVKGSILYSTALACAILFITNFSDTNKLLKLADVRDKEEREHNHNK
ncbi:MAG: CDP-alcohol phosphatidyltransferase [Bacteroidota bacterium]|nr:CDP-alcohol phosphatidyltransferase [Bacteroidota bacterium]